MDLSIIYNQLKKKNSTISSCSFTYLNIKCSLQSDKMSDCQSTKRNSNTPLHVFRKHRAQFSSKIRMFAERVLRLQHRLSLSFQDAISPLPIATSLFYQCCHRHIGLKSIYLSPIYLLQLKTP